jgi:hypothetical protein
VARILRLSRIQNYAANWIFEENHKCSDLGLGLRDLAFSVSSVELVGNPSNAAVGCFRANAQSLHASEDVRQVGFLTTSIHRVHMNSTTKDFGEFHFTLLYIVCR